MAPLRLLSLLLLASLFLHLTVAQLSGDSQVASLVPRAPVYNLPFSAAPNSVIGTAPLWTWASTDPLDSGAAAQYHQGVAILQGTSTSWIDLTQTTGNQSAGAAIPVWGGNGYYGAGSPQNGWSLEVVFKFDLTVVQGWAKVFELSDSPGGGTGNNLAFSFDNNDAGNDSGYKLMVEQYMNNVQWPQASHGLIEALKPQVNTWYHAVLMFQPSGTAGAANWMFYVNGQNLGFATYFGSNVTLAPQSGANMPQNIPRPVSTLGKSAWNDPYAAVTIDAFRVYDYTLAPGTISALAAAYGCNIGNKPLVSNTFPVTAEVTAINGLVPTPPIFNAVFGQNPTTGGTVTAPTNYQWMQSDPNDSPANQALHQGLVQVNGGITSYVDLTTPYGPNSVGLVLPIIGTPGSGTGATQGLTVETVVKFPILPTNTFRAKVWDWGSGASADSFDLSFDNNGGQFCLENQVARPNSNAYALLDFNLSLPINQPYPNTWYHIFWVLSQPNMTSYTSTWTPYINGVQASNPLLGAPWPLPVYRQFSWLAGSDWADANTWAIYDAVRIYDYALNGAQIANIYNALYNATTTATGTATCQPAATGAASGDLKVAALVPRPALFKAEFTTSAPCATGQRSSWLWAAQDVNDNGTVAAVHQGVAVLNGAALSYIDLATATGPQSMGQAMPQWGGNGFYGAGNALNGWSLEIVFKATTSVSQGWAKVLELSDGPGWANGNTGNNIALTFDANDQANDSGFKLMVEQYMNQTQFPQAGHGLVEAFKPQVNTWYHVVMMFQPVTSPAGAANWYFYVNGQNLGFASYFVPNATLAPQSGANMPQNIPRPVSTIGKSAWGDPLAQVTVDAFRVYDYLLTANTISNLAGAYNLNIGNPPQVNTLQPLTAEAIRTQAVVPTPPIFNAVFSVNPVTLGTVSSSPNYQWMAFDPADTAANQQTHTGLIYINGSSSSYIDLSTVYGANSIGQVLPIIGTQGSGSGTGASSTVGLTVEVMVKFPVLPTGTFRAKIFDFGSGASADSFDLTFDNNGAQFALEVQNAWPNGNTYALTDVLQTPRANTWYHLVWVLNNVSFTSYTATWTPYINGVQSTLMPSYWGFFPLPVYRQFSWLGGSDWADANTVAIFDTVRVYDYALTAQQVGGLYAQYTAPVCVSTPVKGGDAVALSLVQRQPVFNLNFSVSPGCITGAAPGWTWAVQDPYDNAQTAALHQGVAILTASSTSWVDLTTAKGPQSAGQVIPQWGGDGFYGAGNPQNGWSLEIVFKMDVTVSQGWAKVLELSDGPGWANTGAGNVGSNIALTFDNNDAGNDSGYKLMVEQYNNQVLFPQTGHGLVEMLQPQVNTWYHVVMMFQPVASPPGAANWMFYVNGQNLGFATYFGSNVTLAPQSGANMPQNIPRPVSTMGKSAWNDPYVAATIDAFRVYDYVLDPATIGNLAGAYGLNIPARPQVSNVPAVPETSATNGLVPTPPIFNAVFGQNPTSLSTVGPAINYKWMQSDPSDSAADQQRHTGLVALNGSTLSYISLSTVYGPNSVGQALPILGTQGSGSGATQGLSVEVVVKFPVLPTATFRAKIFDFGSGASADSFDLSFDNNGAAFCLENQNAWPNGNTYGLADFYLAPKANTWYHLVWVLNNVNFTSYTATWNAYGNGVPSTINPLTAGWYPLPVFRQFSWLGGSDWGDANTAAVFDAVRIYDYALTASQVQSLYSMYGTVSNNPQTSGGGGSSGLGLSGGQVAGIVVGCVIGTALLCCIFFVFMFPMVTGERSMKTHKSAADAPNTKFDQMEPSQTTPSTNAGDVEMQ